MQKSFTQNLKLLLIAMMSLGLLSLTACQSETESNGFQAPSTTGQGAGEVDELPPADLGITDEEIDALNKSVADIDFLADEIKALLPSDINITNLDDLKDILEDELRNNLGSIGDIEDKIQDAIDKINDKIALVGVDHPDLQRLKDRIAEIQDRIDQVKDQIGNIKGRVADLLDKVVDKLDDLIAKADPGNLIHLILVAKLEELKDKVQDFQDKLRS